MKKLIIIIGILLFCSCLPQRKEFNIKITFCDGREPLITKTYSRTTPSSYHIKNKGMGEFPGPAVPEYITYEYIPSGSPIKADNFKTKKYLNVCDVQIIE